MKDFKNIYIAARDAAAGAVNDKEAFQMNIGTTLKGLDTPFYMWYTDVKKKQERIGMKIYYWYVFDPTRFDINIPIHDQRLTQIVPWHSLVKLERKRFEDPEVFGEEFMCTPTSKEDAFYPLGVILSVINNKLKHYSAAYRDGKWFVMEPPNPEGKYWMGVDVASLNDYFVITIYEQVDEKYIQRFLYYKRGIDIDFMEDLCNEVIDVWAPIRIRVDANLMGFQLAQNLYRRYGARVDALRGSKMSSVPSGSASQGVKGLIKGQRVPINEFLHTNQKRLMVHHQIELLNDELQISHYSQWDRSFSAKSTKELGHGDSAIAGGMAILPIKYRASKRISALKTNLEKHNKVEVKALAQEVDWNDS